MTRRIFAAFLSVVMVLTGVLPSFAVNPAAAEEPAAQEYNYVSIPNGTDSAMYKSAKADSEQNPANGNDGPASWAFDGDNVKGWHTRWDGEHPQGEPTQLPYNIEWSVGEPALIGRLGYIRKTNASNGTWKNITVYGKNGENADWTEITTVNGMMNAGDNAEIYITFPQPMTVTHLKVKVSDSYNANGSFASAGEINVYKAEAKAPQGQPQGEKLTISHKQTSGETNKFTFSSQGWSGGDTQHVWSAIGNTAPENVWYTVDFEGNAIEVFAGKNRPMGFVKYYIDNKLMGEYSLYNDSNIQSTHIATFAGLTEGHHTLKAVATGKRDVHSTGIEIDCAQAVVWHQPYQVTGLRVTDPADGSLELMEGAVGRVTVEITPAHASLGDVKFESDHPEIAKVSPDGSVEALAPGDAVITISPKNAGSAQAVTVPVKVTPSVPDLGGLIVDIDTQYIQNRYEEVKNAEAKNAETLTAWKNDKALSEIVLFTKNCALKDVKFTVEDLRSADGSVIGNENIDVTFIKSTKAYNGGYPGYGNRNPPPAVTPTNRDEVSDILYQSARTGMNLPFNSLQPVWVSISVPKDAQAGTYTTTITATVGEIQIPFTYTLNVKDMVLRDAAEYKNHFDIELWQYPYSVAEYYGVTPFSKEHFDILRPHMELYKSIGGHAVTATISEDAWEGQTYSKNEIAYPSMVKWTKVNGEMTYDYTALDKWISFNREMGLGDKIVLYSVAPWHNCFTFWENGKLVKQSFAGQVGSQWYNETWGHFLQDLANHMTEKGWFDAAYIGIDERGLTQEALDVIYSVTNNQGRKFKTASAINDFEGHKTVAMQVTDVTVGDNCVNANFINFEKQRAELGLRTTLYTCTQHRPSNFTRSAPVESYWSVVNAGRYSSGMLRWGYDAWVEDPLRDTTHCAFEPGDCFMVYPGEKDPADRQTRSSIRFERIAQGARDVNKLRQMVELMPDLKPQSDALFNSIRTGAWISNDYLTPAQVNQLRNDMKGFEDGLNALTDTFLSRQASGTDQVQTITIQGKNPLELNVGSTLRLKAELTPVELKDHRVTWSSSAPEIAAVDANGVLTTYREGTADITAASVADPSKTAVVRVKVVSSTIDLASRVSYYNFENQLNDQWGDRPGQGTITYADGKVGQAVRVTPDHRVSFAKRSPLPDYTDAWTVSYWVKSEAPLNGQVSVMMTHDDLFSFCLKLKDGASSGFRVGSGAGDVLTMAYDFQQGQWYHVTWTQSRQDGLTMYVDGRRIAHNDWSKSNVVYAPIDFIGGVGFTGLMDEVKIYNRVLTDQEVAADYVIEGLNVAELNVTLNEGAHHQIRTNLVSSNPDKTITYVSSDEKVATVDENGLVTAVKRGEATITVSNAAAGFSEQVKVTVKKVLPLQNTLPHYELPEKYLKDIEKAPGTERQYLGQPDMVRTRENRLITAYPVGHGHGPLVMRISDDEGETWTEIQTPESWKQSQETPTLYVLNLPNGVERIMLITACPNWDLKKGGWDTAYSDDNGNTWTELRNWHATFPGTNDKNYSIVGMASLVQLRDEQNQPIQKWMGVYHNYGFVNYKTYLTFDENGNEQWSAPEPYLSQYRDIESTYQMCEIGMFRSPDGERIVGLARSQSHNNPATLIYSDDEGETWSKPMDLPGSLSGERHKATYDPVSGRLLITFRQIKHDLNGNGRFDGPDDWRCGSWMAWIGTYEDLMNQDPGEFCVTLDTDYSQNRYGGDTGYSGVVVLEDNTFVIDSYGHFDEEFSKAHGADVRTDLCYIRRAKFKLGEIENTFGRIDETAMEKALADTANVDGSQYTTASFEAFTQKRDKVQGMMDRKDAQQIEIDQAVAELNQAFQALEPAPEEKLFDVAQSGLVLNNNLMFRFAVNVADIQDTTGVYALITHTDANNIETTTRVNSGKWLRDDKKAEFYIDFVGLSAKQMTDQVKVVIYGADNQALSNPYTTSMQAYARKSLDLFKEDQKLRTLLVDMLNYGTAAQIYFQYDVKDLANAILTQEEKDLATQNVTAVDRRVAGENYATTTLSLDNKILLNMYFRNITTINDKTVATVTFTDHYGSEKRDTFFGNEFVPIGNDGVMGVPIDSLAVADVQQTVTCVVKQDNVVVASATDSMAGYIIRALEKSDDANLKSLMETIMKFGQSSAQYFDKIQK